jgi:hypothetical protein
MARASSHQLRALFRAELHTAGSWTYLGVISALLFVFSTVHPSNLSSGASLQITGYIQTSNGFFLSAWKNGGVGGANLGTGATALHTDATKAGPWELFSIIFIDATHFALKTANGQYVTAINGGGAGNPSPQFAIGTIRLGGLPGSNETFSITAVGGGKVTISTSDGHYVTAVNGGGFGGPNDVPIHTDATSMGPWEHFTWVSPMDPLHSHGVNSPDSPPSCLAVLQKKACPPGS